MEKSVLHYFIDTNSSRGFVSFWESNFGKLKNVVKLDGYPDLLVTQMVSQACAQALGEDLEVELIHNCLDNSLQGILLPGLDAGLVNFPAYSDESYSVRLTADENLSKARAGIQEAYGCFAQALAIHDDWEKIYISNIDFKTLDQLAEETAAKLLGGGKTENAGSSVDRFFGAATVNGSYDYIPNITQEIPKRYFLKGRPGTGKSTFLKKIGKAAQDRGYRVEIYHCAFDPNSLDMLVIRELGVCVFDSTSPHEYFPERETDEIIDIYEAAVKPGTDETFQEEIAGCSAGYKAKVKEAVQHLGEARLAYHQYQRGVLDAANPDRRIGSLDWVIGKLFGR